METSPLKNPKGPDTGQYRVLRGGSWIIYPNYLRVANRGYGYPTGIDNNDGFRCVADVEE